MSPKPFLGILLAIVAWAAVPLRPVDAAPITVTTTVDALDTDGDWSLREAVRAANTNVAVDDLVISGAGAAMTIIQACAVEQLSADCPSAIDAFHCSAAKTAKAAAQFTPVTCIGLAETLDTVPERERSCDEPSF